MIGVDGPQPLLSTTFVLLLHVRSTGWHHKTMRDQRGLSNGVQTALLFPVAFGMLLLTLQWALVAWADASALAAAQDGARASAVINGSSATGESVAREAAANGALENVEVTVARGAITTMVTVRGTAQSLLPGVRPTVSKAAEVPTERLTNS